MSNKTKALLKGASIILAILVILMELEFINIPVLDPHKIWMMVISYGILLVSTK
jgi:hypothetical protein